MRVGIFFISIIISVFIYAESAIDELSPEVRNLVYLSQKPCNDVLELVESRNVIMISGFMHNPDSIKSMPDSELDDYIKEVRDM